MNGQNVSYPASGSMKLAKTSTRLQRPHYFYDLVCKSMEQLYVVCYLERTSKCLDTVVIKIQYKYIKIHIYK